MQLQETYGIQLGDRVSISMRNYPEWCLAFIAVTRMGATAVPLNSMWKGAEYEYGLQDSGSKVFFCDPERYAMAKEACDKLEHKARQFFRSFCAARSMWWTMSPSMACTRP